MFCQTVEIIVYVIIFILISNYSHLSKVLVIQMFSGSDHPHKDRSITVNREAPAKCLLYDHFDNLLTSGVFSSPNDREISSAYFSLSSASKFVRVVFVNEVF